MALQLVPGAIIEGRFALVRPLGKGGMGEVWLARHEKLGGFCAVKFIYAEAAVIPEARARFELEAKAAAQIRSTHVVQVLDSGECEGTPFLAMEYLEGEDLEHRLRRVRALEPRDTADIVGQVARALTRAHAAGLVHRDLKPANVFLCREDDHEVVKVLDFGVAKRTDDVAQMHTVTGALIGTPFYMSPEQAQGVRAVDHRADLWALAVIAYRCITGQLPFHSEALGDLLVRIIVQPIPVPSQVAPVPQGFDAWWARASSRDPAGRFQTAKELAEALRMALGLSATNAFDAPTQPPRRNPLRVTVPLEPDFIPSPPAYLGGGRPTEVTPAPSPLALSAAPASSMGPVVAPRPPGPKRGKGTLGMIAVALVLLATAAILAVTLLAPRRTRAPAPAASPSPSAPEPPRSALPMPSAAPSVSPAEPASPASASAASAAPTGSAPRAAPLRQKGAPRAAPSTTPGFDPGI